MKKAMLLIVIISTVLFSCSNSKKKNLKIEKENAKKALVKKTSSSEIKDYFEVIVDFKAEQNDNFQLFYSEEYTLSFPEIQSVNRGFLGNELSQTVVFRIPDDIFPVRFRLDVGSNISQKFIKIYSFKIRYDKHEINILEENILNYLVPNTFIRKEGDIFYMNPIETDGETVYDPYFTCSPHLVKLISEL